MIRVLIADAHTVLRHGLRLILQQDPNLTVVGEAASSAEVLACATNLSPDIVLMDLNLNGANGVETIRQVRKASPQTEVVVLTVSDQSESMLAACKAGVKGYLLKSVSGKDVVQAIHRVAAGQAVLPPDLTTQLLNELANPAALPETLTGRELDVLRCMIRGHGNKEIAAALNISQNTVKTHVRRILSKLHLRNRTEAVAYAVQSDLFP